MYGFKGLISIDVKEKIVIRGETFMSYRFHMHELAQILNPSFRNIDLPIY